jgi:lactam utilization protein B
VSLPRLAVGNFAGSGDLKSFGDSFMRLSHDEILEKINL